MPVPAVQRGEPGTFVYVINADNTVSVRPIKVGPTDGGYQAVLSGLQPGDRVVTDGTDRLRDGARSRAATAERAPAGAPGGTGSRRTAASQGRSAWPLRQGRVAAPASRERTAATRSRQQ